MSFDPTSRPNAIPWPPILYGGAAVLAVGLGRFVPLPAPGGAAIVIAGWIAIAAGLGLDLWAMATMARARTNILPHRAADRLVVGGPFRLTRNPIYVGNAIWISGLGLAFANLWFVVLALAAAVGVHRLAILREEGHLAAKFGPAWADYAARVPRWIVR